MITGHHFTDEQIPTQLGVRMFSHFHVSAYWDIRFCMLANICSLSTIALEIHFFLRWQCNIKREITLIRTFKIIWAHCDFMLFEWILEINWLAKKFELLEYMYIVGISEIWIATVFRIYHGEVADVWNVKTYHRQVSEIWNII